MLTGGANPSINQRIVDGLGDGFKALLLRSLVGVIKIELINELI
jgi:hypothetical protein